MTARTYTPCGGCRDLGPHTLEGNCEFRPTLGSRPTHAQVTASDELTALLADCTAAAAIAVTFSGLDMLREVSRTAIALRTLIKTSEGWIEAARAHCEASRPIVAAIRRAGEDR